MNLKNEVAAIVNDHVGKEVYKVNEHTKEPWHVFKYGVQSENNWTIAITDTKLNNGEANARRIVACVNACAGIQEENLHTMQTASKSLDAWKQLIDRIAELDAEQTHNRKCIYSLEGYAGKLNTQIAELEQQLADNLQLVETVTDHRDILQRTVSDLGQKNPELVEDIRSAYHTAKDSHTCYTLHQALQKVGDK